MRSHRLSLPAHQPSIFSEESFNENRLHATQSYEIEEQMEMMISANQIIDEICHKREREIDELLRINVTIVEEIMKNKLIRGLKGEKMMMLAICELVILIKENTLSIKRSEGEFELKHFQQLDHKVLRQDSDPSLNDVLEELEVIRNCFSTQDRSRLNAFDKTMSRLQRKLSQLITPRSKLDIIRAEHEKLLSQQRAIRQLLQQQLQDYQKEIKILRERSDLRTSEQSQELQRLRQQIMDLRVRQGELINELRIKEDYDANQILNSDILPMLLVQGLSLETILDNQ